MVVKTPNRTNNSFKKKKSFGLSGWHLPSEDGFIWFGFCNFAPKETT